MGAKLSLRRNKIVKVCAVLLFVISAFSMVGSAYVTLYLYSHNYYAASVEKLSHELMNDLCADDMYILNERYTQLCNEGYFDEKISDTLRTQLYEGFMDNYKENSTNFFFTISDLDDHVLLSSYKSASQCAQVQVFRNTSYEPVKKRMTPEEYENFSFPDNAENCSVEEVYIEAATEPFTETTYDLEEMHRAAEEAGFVMEYDEEGAFIRGVSPSGFKYTIRFDEQGEPYAVENYDSVVEEDDSSLQEVPASLMYDVRYSMPYTDGGYYISGYVRSDFKVQDRYANVHETVCNRYNFRYVFPSVAIVGGLLTLTCLIYLISAAGYRKNSEAACAGLFDKIPFDVFTAALLGLTCCFFFLEDTVHDDSYLEAAYITGIVTMCMVIILWWLMSIAVRIRTGTMISNNLIAIVVRRSMQSFKRIGSLIGEFLASLPSIWQVVIFTVCFAVTNIFCALLWEFEHLIGLGAAILLWTIFVMLLCLIAYNLHILEKGGQRMADGNLEDRIPEEKLFWRFRKHAEALNSLGTGMNKAVNDRLKSEMFRTELIANVSHDIRTPLTSIINYTDLLSKLNLDNAQAQEYITILVRQSARLRKLTEDVLEASKATTGNIKVEKRTMDLRVLLEQTEGEFIERLEEKHLTLVKDMLDTPQYISVDGRLLWRVLDNLFGNICKYAMEGTRVYLNVLKMENEVICMLRNISATQLNISAEALLERFVQGDRSRNTEGSGLGLSIAQSLTTLQGGQLDLQIDGDLFKVILRFPCAPPPELPTEMTP